MELLTHIGNGRCLVSKHFTHRNSVSDVSDIHVCTLYLVCSCKPIMCLKMDEAGTDVASSYWTSVNKFFHSLQPN